MATDTERNHYERINQIRQYIRAHMDEPLSREELARMAGYSVIHFHRIFTAHVCESLNCYVRRVRMERAARQLLQGERNITAIALNSGYETPASFGKAFKQTFGVSPSEFRELEPMAAGHLIYRQFLYNRKGQLMQPLEIRTLPDMQVLYARATERMTSPAFQTANQEAFGQLMGHVGPLNIWDKVRHMVAIYPDPVEVDEEARFDAGVIFVDDYAPPAPNGLAYQTLPGGRWAVFRHVGPYDTLWQTWQAALRDWLPTSGEEMRDAIPFEDYVDDPSQTEPEQLRTDIFIPIK
ncbi:MAG: AraC family transcriptional regulator [Caldilineaceae bacterium]